MSPIGVKKWQIRPIQLTAIITSYGFVYYCRSLIFANTLFMNVCHTVTNSSMKKR